MAEAIKKIATDVDRLEADFIADPGTFVPLARAYMERNLPLEAIRICKKGLSRNPGVENGHLALAMAYYHNWDDNRAEAGLKKVLKTSPQNYIAHRTLGEIYLERKQDKKALDEFVQALGIEPRDLHTRALLKSLEETVPDLDESKGQPEEDWPPRQIHKTNLPPKSFLWALAQILVVAGIMIGLKIWYDHHVEIKVAVRESIKKAAELVPNDNFDDLLKAEKELLAAAALDPDEERVVVRQAFIHNLLFEHHAQADRLDKMKTDLAWMEEAELPNPERFSLQAILMMEEGKIEEAEKFLGDTIKRAIEKKDIYLNAMVFGTRGTAQKKLGKMKEAREDYSRAARFSSLSPNYQSQFADIYLREGNLPRAIRYFKDALRINPGHIFTNIRLALSYTQQGKYPDKAKKILDDLTDEQKYPKEKFSPPLIGMLYLAKAELALITKEEGPPKANDFLRQSITAYDKSAEAYNLKGRLAALDKDGATATQAFAKALQLDPRLPKVYFDRAESMFALDQKPEAIAKLQDFEKFLTPTVAYYVKKGSLQMRVDDLETALANFNKGIETDELNPDPRFHVGLVYQTMADKLDAEKENADKKRELYNKARQSYEDSMMLPGGERYEVHRQMGLIYRETENYENALNQFGKAVLMMGKNRMPSEKIAVLYGDVATVFKALGGPEGEKQEQSYLMKQKALMEGKSVEQVEKEAADQAKAEEEKKKKKRKRRRRRRRSR